MSQSSHQTSFDDLDQTGIDLMTGDNRFWLETLLQILKCIRFLTKINDQLTAFIIYRFSDLFSKAFLKTISAGKATNKRKIPGKVKFKDNACLAHYLYYTLDSFKSTDFATARHIQMKKISGLFLTILLLAAMASAQTAEVTIQLNEQFFDALLDALFKNANQPEFPLSVNNSKSEVPNSKTLVSGFNEAQNPKPKTQNQTTVCNDSIRLQREIDGTRTAVRFREGKIYAPIAFSGNYNPPLIGCLDFAGVAETNIELEFDAQKQALVGRAKVLTVNLSGAGGIGSGLLARMVQNSIDKKVNPIQILAMDKISFVVPIQNAGSLKMKANGIRYEITNGALNVRISYEFQ